MKTHFEWVFEKLMHNPPEEQLEDLLPANWLKTRPPPPARPSRAG
ncbi:MAG: hypothetical protein ACO3JG_10230 [Luteolibacter sp.]